MKRFPSRGSILAAVVLCVATLGFSVGSNGCETTQRGYISVEAIDEPVQTVTERHDKYVAADQELSDVERSTAMRTSELLRAVINEARREAEEGTEGDR